MRPIRLVSADTRTFWRTFLGGESRLSLFGKLGLGPGLVVVGLTFVLMDLLFVGLHKEDLDDAEVP